MPTRSTGTAHTSSRVINGTGERMMVTWHWRKDLSDEVEPWTGRLP